MRHVLNRRGERVRRELATRRAPGRAFTHGEAVRRIAEYTDRDGGSYDYFRVDDTLPGMPAVSAHATRGSKASLPMFPVPRAAAACTAFGVIDASRTAGYAHLPFHQREPPMPMDINIQLSDDDLGFFVKGMRDAEGRIRGRDAESIVAQARAQLADMRSTHLPPFIAERLGSVESLIAMESDPGFNLPEADRKRVLAALAYLADTDDLIPDTLPVLGFLDDAIVIELCRRDLQFEIEAYDDFVAWREGEARARGEDPSTLAVQRSDWAESQAAEAIARMQRRRRDSYASGSWRPTLFKVS